MHHPSPTPESRLDRYLTPLILAAVAVAACLASAFDVWPS